MNWNQQRLAGKVAVVTGIGAGIGKGCARMFAHQGAKVVGSDIDAASAQATVAEISREGLVMHSVHPCDLTKPEDVQKMFEVAIKLHGRLDVLVTAAAFSIFAPIDQMTFEQWRKTLAGELDIVFLACKYAWPHMIASGGGSIINFSSVNSHLVLEGSAAVAHCAAKGGVLAMTRQLAVEGAPHNIRANMIAPGMTVTAATAPVLEIPGFKENVFAHAMIKRFGQPEDIAWCATYLASDESCQVTATEIFVDAGAHAL